MDCKQIKAYLSEYVDGFLPNDVKEQVEAHLQVCAACKAEADALLKLRGEIRAMKLENTDDFAFDLARAKAPVAVALHQRKWVRALSAAAACFVLFIGVYAAVQNGYRTTVEQQDFSIGEAEPDETADVVNIEEADTVQNAKSEKQSHRVKTVTVTEDFTYRSVPEDVTPFSSGVQLYEGKEEGAIVQAETFSAANAPANEPLSAMTDSAVTEVTVPESAPERVAVDATADDMSSGASSGGGGGAASGGSASGGAAVQVYTKRTVTLSVSDAARETFLNTLSGMQLAGFDGECVISEASLQQLLSIAGVQSLSDEATVQDTDRYLGKIVIIY